MEKFGKGIDHWDHKRLVLEMTKFSDFIGLDLSSGISEAAPFTFREDEKLEGKGVTSCESSNKNLMALLMFVRTTIHKNPPSSL